MGTMLHLIKVLKKIYSTETSVIKILTDTIKKYYY